MLGHAPSHLSNMLPPVASSQTTGAAVAFDPKPVPLMVMVPLWFRAPLTCWMSGALIAGSMPASTPIQVRTFTARYTGHPRCQISLCITYGSPSVCRQGPPGPRFASHDHLGVAGDVQDPCRSRAAWEIIANQL